MKKSNPNRKWIIVSIVIILLIGGIFIFFKVQRQEKRSEAAEGFQIGNFWGRSNMMGNNSGSRGVNMMGNRSGGGRNNRMTSVEDIKLKASKQPGKPLLLPPVLEPTIEKENNVTYDIVAKNGEFQIKEGAKTKTLGYNGDFLGPIIRLRKGQKVTLNTTNQLDSRTSFHWHGLKIPSDADGGPHQIIEAGEKKTVSFTVDQEASTLWFHPHPEGETASQVYRGLAGLMYIDDENSDSLDIPKNYGVDDFPLIVQDKSFDSNNQINYEEDYYSDGTQGDNLLINGTINPYVDISKRWIRYRIVSGSNSRNFTFNLSNNDSFYQIASDGGFLNKAEKLTTLTLSPGERAEILIDTKKLKKGDNIKLLANKSVALTMRINKKETNVNFSPTEKLNSLENIVENDFSELNRQTINLQGMSHMVSINNKQFDMDRIDLYKKLNTQEIWEINNRSSMMGSLAHPFHIHGVQFRVLSRNGESPSENEKGWKDTVLVNPEEKVELLVKFDQPGIFMYHCHILEHEEFGMMGQLQVRSNEN